jgi:hypothetical protein
MNGTAYCTNMLQYTIPRQKASGGSHLIYYNKHDRTVLVPSKYISLPYNWNSAKLSAKFIRRWCKK